MALPPKREAFCREFVATRNAAEAYRRAGYSAPNDHTAAAGAARLLTIVDIQERIAQLTAPALAAHEITVAAVIAGLKTEAQGAGADTSSANRIKAWQLLGEHLGMFADQAILKALGDLGKRLDALDRSRNPGSDRQPADGPGGASAATPGLG